MAFNKDISVEQGSTFTMSVVVQDANGYELDLTGYTADAQVREGYADDTTVIETFSTSIDALVGTVTISLTASQTRGMSFAYGRYDVEVTDSLNVVTRIIEGRIRMSKEVTRVA